MKLSCWRTRKVELNLDVTHWGQAIPKLLEQRSPQMTSLKLRTSPCPLKPVDTYRFEVYNSSTTFSKTFGSQFIKLRTRIICFTLFFAREIFIHSSLRMCTWVDDRHLRVCAGPQESETQPDIWTVGWVPSSQEPIQDGTSGRLPSTPGHSDAPQRERSAVDSRPC